MIVACDGLVLDNGAVGESADNVAVGIGAGNDFAGCDWATAVELDWGVRVEEFEFDGDGGCEATGRECDLTVEMTNVFVNGVVGKDDDGGIGDFGAKFGEELTSLTGRVG